MMRLKSVKIFTWIASVGLVGSALILSFITLFPVNVISNWTLNIAKDKYSLGDTVVIESLYTKNVQAEGRSQRYLECKNDNSIFVRYLINEAKADRQKAKTTGTGVVVTIPSNIAEVNLPTECFFSIAISYNVYPRRAETEYARTKSFTLYKTLPETTSNSNVSTDGDTTTTTTDTTTKTTNTNTTTTVTPVTPDPPAEPTDTPPDPDTTSLLTRLTSPITNFVKGIL